MSYTLRIWRNDKIVRNPTLAEIRAMLADSQDDGPVLNLSTDGSIREIQVTGAARDGFGFDYRKSEGDTWCHAQRHDYSLDAAMQLLTAFMAGGNDWKALAEWKAPSFGSSEGILDRLLKVVFRLLGMR